MAKSKGDKGTYIKGKGLYTKASTKGRDAKVTAMERLEGRKCGQNKKRPSGSTAGGKRRSKEARKGLSVPRRERKFCWLQCDLTTQTREKKEPLLVRVVSTTTS